MPLQTAPSRSRALLLGAFAAFASLLSCGREVTGPGSGPRPSHPIAFLTTLPGPLASVEAGAGSVIPFDRVRVILRRGDGSEAFAQTFPFGGNADSIAISPVVTLLSDGDSETFALFLRYLNAQGDTVFAGGPVSVTAVNRNFRGERPPPAEVPLNYTGPGAGATSVTIAPDTIRVTAGEPFEFVTTARDGQGVEVPSPILHTSSDTTRAVLPDSRFGSGLTRPSRGTVTIRAVLPNGNAEAFGVLEIAPAPASITRVGSEPLRAPVGTTLLDSVRVRLLATDGLPIAGATIDVGIDGGGSVNDSSLVTDADGRAAVTWTLGTIVGTQSNTLRFTTPGWGTLLVTAEGTEPQSTAVRARILSIPAEPQVSLEPVVAGIEVVVVDAGDQPVPSYTGPLTLEVVTVPSGGNILGTVDAAVAQGTALFDAWTANVAGTYVLRVTGPGIAPDTTGPIEFVPGVAANTTVLSGSNQVGLAGELIPQPIVLLVEDQAGNPVPDWQVLANVTVGGGTITPTSQFTDSTGTVTFTQWTLGAAGTNTVEFLVEGAGVLAVNATADPPPPAIALSVVGSNVVGVGRSGSIRVRLLQPAPVGGVLVTTVIDSTQYLGFAEGGTLAFAEGETENLLEVNGLAAGTAVLRTSATGYISDTLVVPVSLNLISLPQTLNVPLAQTAALPVSLSAPAPAGGVRVALTVDNPGVAQPVTDTVFIAAGTQSVNVDIEGLALGTANITASNPNYAPAGTSVNVTAGVNITATSFAINQSFGLPATIQLLSGATPVAAPPGGITIALSADDALCASVPPSVTIAEGFTSTTVNVVYGGSAPTPCATVFRAAGPAGFATDSASVTVAVTPLANLPAATYTIGSGLQRQLSVTLGATNHGGTTVRFSSADSTRVLVAANSSSVGSGFVDVPVGIGGNSASVFVQAREGFTNDSALVFAAAPGFVTDSIQVRLFQPVYEVVGLSGTQTAGAADDAFYARIGSPSSATGGLSSVDEVRPGGDTVRVSFVSDSVQRGTLVTSTSVADSIEFLIPPLAIQTPTSLAAGGVAFRPLASGPAVVRTVIPGFRVTTGSPATINISAPSISALTTLNVGAGLQRGGSISVSAAPADTLPVRLYFDRPGAALLSANGTTVGVDTLIIPWEPGATSYSFFVQGLEGRIADTLTLTADAPGYTPRTSTIRVFRAVFEIIGISATATTLAADDAFYVRIGTPTSPLTASTLSSVDPLRPGAPPLSIDLLNDTPGIITLAQTAGTSDSLRYTLNAGQSTIPTSVASGGPAVRYLAEGTGSVRVSVPGLRPSGNVATQAITVTAPSISSLSALNLGSGLQRSGTVTLSQAPVDTTRVRLTFNRPGVALLAPNDSTLGTDTLELVFPPGTSSRPYTVQALEGFLDDTLQLQASAPGFTGRTATVRVLQPVVELVGVNTSLTTLSLDDPFQVRIGSPSSPTSALSTVDGLRVGSPGVTAVLTTSNGTVGRLVTSTTAGDTVTRSLLARANVTPTTVAAGGVALDPLTVGSTSVSVSIAGFRSVAGATATVTIAAPTITLSAGNPTVGAGLQVVGSGSLNVGTHGGLSVVLRSSNPAVLLLSNAANVPASDSIIVNVGDGVASFSFYVAGVEGATGAVTVEAEAIGFVGSQTTRNVVTPAIRVDANLAATGTAGVTADDAFTVSVGLPNGQLTDLATTQAVRAGGTLAVTIASSDSTVGSLVTNASPSGTGSTILAIAGSSATSPSSVATGGVAFRFVSPGGTTVSATAPGFTQVTSGQRLVTVNSP